MRNFQQNTVRAKNIPINSGLSWWFELDHTETSNDEQPKITDNNLTYEYIYWLTAQVKIKLKILS